jgi:excisionase family DNA binding protein
MGVVGTQTAAKKLGVSVRRVQAMITAGTLKAMRVSRDWLIDQADLDALAAKARKPGRPGKQK